MKLGSKGLFTAQLSQMEQCSDPRPPGGVMSAILGGILTLGILPPIHTNADSRSTVISVSALDVYAEEQRAAIQPPFGVHPPGRSWPTTNR